MGSRGGQLPEENQSECNDSPCWGLYVLDVCQTLLLLVVTLEVGARETPIIQMMLLGPQAGCHLPKATQASGSKA